MMLFKRNGIRKSLIQAPALFLGLSFLLSLVYSNSAYAQAAQKWYFGIDIGLDFSGGGSPTLINTTSPATYDNSGVGGYNVESSSVAYDNSGNLVFIAIPTGAGAYSVFDKNFVNKGNVRTTSDAAQGSLIFPTPGSTTQYYLCTVDAMTSTCGTGDTGSDRGANYYVVNNTGSTITLGAANNLVASGVAECQVGIVHANATDYWWIIHVRGSNEFRVYKVTSSGITYDHSNNLGYAFGACDYVSQLAVNGCNNKIAMTINGTVSLFDFDNSTGTISNSQQWNLACAYGLEFSTNNNYLYISTGTDSGCSTPSIYEFDISSGLAGTISGTSSNLGATNGGIGKSGHLQLGPDGNIYVAQMSAYGGFSYPQYIGRITSINSKPASFNKNFLAVNDATNGKMAVSMGLPTILKASITGQATVSIPNANSICVNNNSTFSYNFVGVAVSQTWSLSPSTGFSYVAPSTSTSASPTIKFTTPGTYAVTVDVTDNCGYHYTDVTNITVHNQVNSAGTINCSPFQGNVTSPGAYTYVWYADAALTQPIATGTTNVALPNAGAGTYYVAAQTSASSANTTNTLLSSSSAITTYDAAAGTNYTQITVSKTTTINSFQWAPSGINYGTNPTNKTYTLSITDVAGSNVWWTTTATVNVYNNLPLQTANPSIKLPPGIYRIRVVGPASSNPNGWTCGCTPTVAGDNAVTVTGGNTAIGNLNYTATTITETALACSNAGSVTFNCPLPVTWLDFTARRADGSSSVLLNWSTAIEENNAMFYIQRSLDGASFETIGQQIPAGNSTSVKHYDYIDLQAPVNNVYYRIQQVDVDGKSSFSKIVYVNGVGALDISLVPNPGHGSFTITGLSGDAKLSVQVYTVTGQSVFAATTSPGELIDLGDVAKGFYIVKVVSGTTEKTIRYINQ